MNVEKSIFHKPSCRWCGKKLMTQYEKVLPPGEFHYKKTGKIDGYGAYGNNFFCSQRCGFNYAVRSCGGRLYPKA